MKQNKRPKDEDFCRDPTVAQNIVIGVVILSVLAIAIGLVLIGLN